MERFIIKYSNGKIRQQRGINMTYQTMLSIGVIDYIIDTKLGEIMLSDSDEKIHTRQIAKYDDSDLISPKD